MGDHTAPIATRASAPSPHRSGPRRSATRCAACGAASYLRFLGDERLAVMGYDGEELIEQLDPSRWAHHCCSRTSRSLIGDIAREPVRVRMRRRGIGGPNVIRELLRA